MKRLAGVSVREFDEPAVGKLLLDVFRREFVRPEADGLEVGEAPMPAPGATKPEHDNQDRLTFIGSCQG